jgi:hypothetical protein
LYTGFDAQLDLDFRNAALVNRIGLFDRHLELGPSDQIGIAFLKIDFFGLSHDPSIWMDSTILEGEALKILTM